MKQLFFGKQELSVVVIKYKISSHAGVYFFPYTVGKIFDGRKSPKLMFFSRSHKFNGRKSPVSIRNVLSAKKTVTVGKIIKVSGRKKSLFEMLGICNFLCILKIFSPSYAKRSVLEAWHLKNTIKITKTQRFTTFKTQLKSWQFKDLQPLKDFSDHLLLWFFPSVTVFCWQRIFNRHGTFPTIFRSGKKHKFWTFPTVKDFSDRIRKKITWIRRRATKIFRRCRKTSPFNLS